MKRTGFWQGLVIGIGVLGMAVAGHASTFSPEIGCLSTLEASAESVIDAVCTEVENGWVDTEKGKIQATEYTFQVNRTFKGAAVSGETWVIRQFGWQHEPDTPSIYIPAIGARYYPGKRYILFLYGESALGLRNAVGFSAGQFSVSQDSAGNLVVSNGLANRGLTSCGEDATASLDRGVVTRVQATSQDGGALAYDDFVTMIGGVRDGK